MGDGPVSAVESVAFLVVMLGIVYIVVEALEAAPIGFQTQADDYIEDAAGGVDDVWSEVA
ncbi:hypothetical protein [Halobacterium jilantaiense]|uniref:Uncharacterized protein n=1 Tax=Halobacterium jilantaiense TaxID=355548 RepID=A0A1I0P795_9EURY|nr:hypothetical protein [Halobacterium jilantaiense]SEW10068.1 hypothetical protein SAMN04487945_1448 [Halobacterium jilantaiense]